VWLGDGNVDIDMISGAAEFTIHERDVYGSGVVPFKDIGTIFLNVSWNFHESVATNLAF
jgi:hypothetical protein